MATITIKSGDTLSGLAAKNGVSTASILAANPSIKDPNKIYAGGTLTIPTALPKATTPTVQTTTAQRTADTATQTKYAEVVASKTPTIVPNSTTGKTPVGSVSSVSTPAQPTNNTGKQPNAVSVVSYVDNKDGTTTNTLSDGSTSTVRYVKNKDGSLTPVEVGTGSGKDNLLDAEKNYSAQTRQQLADLDSERDQFDAKLSALAAQNNSLYSSTIDSIKSTFGVRRDTLAKAYDSLTASRAKAGYQTDAFRYTPMQAEGLVTNDESNYISDLASLDSQEQGLLLQAATAKNAKDWDALSKQMTMYDQISTKKSDLLGKLLTVAQQQNTRIEAEQKIAREANALPTSATAITLAKAVAPAMVQSLKGLTKDAAEAYLTEKSTALKIDIDVLRGALQDQGVQNLKDAKALAPDKGRAPTETETKNSNYGKLQQVIDENPTIGGNPILDVNGFLNPKSFKALQSWGANKGVTRKDIIENHPEIFYLDGIDAYGLTPAEKKVLGI